MASLPEHVRVLRVIARLNIGGPAIHTILLTKLLDPCRFQTTLVTGQVAQTEGDMGYLAAQKGVAPQFIPELGREIHWQNDVLAFWKLYRLMRSIRPTILHTHTAKAGMLGRLAARIAGTPIIVHTFHGHVFHSYFSPRKTQMFLQIERTLARFTDAIITVSPRQREEILTYRIGRPANVHAIGLGLELEPFVTDTTGQGKLRQELQLMTDIPLVGIVGRLVPVKGHTDFLQAAQQVLQHNSSVHFLIFGDGEMRGELEQQAHNLGITAHVHFLGFRPNSPHLYADLDAVVLSSLNEGLPVTLIEAMAAGKPVVSTQVGGVSDLIQPERTGLLVPAKDPSALAEGMLRLLALPKEDRVKMGAAGRASVYPKYDIATLVKNIESLYDRLLTAKGIVTART